ncbi:MAG: hypothetical protein U1E78_05805 [Gammaproteobacteria bacterium]
MIESYNLLQGKVSKPKRRFPILSVFGAYILFAPITLLPFHIGSILSFTAMGLAAIALNKANSKNGLSSRGFSLNASEQLHLAIFAGLGLSISIYGGWMFPIALLAMSFIIGIRYYQLILARHLENQNEALLEKCKNISDSGVFGVVSGFWNAVEITALLAGGAQPGLLLQRQGGEVSLMPGYGENLSRVSKSLLLATLVSEFNSRIVQIGSKPQPDSAENEEFMRRVFENMRKAFSENQNIRARWENIKQAPSIFNLPLRPFLGEIVNSIGDALDHWNKAIRLLMPLTVSTDVAHKPYSAAYRVEKRERKVIALVDQLKTALGEEASAVKEAQRKRQQHHAQVVTWMRRDEAANSDHSTIYSPEDALNLLSAEKAELRQRLKL